MLSVYCKSGLRRPQVSTTLAQVAVTYAIHASPIGDLLLIAHAGELTGLYVIGQRHTPQLHSDWVADNAAFVTVRQQLDEYFQGSRLQFELPLRLVGSDFQQTVWGQLLQIPYGTTISYAELAKQVGNPKGSRAVGLANGRNPISIIVPCHRVIGATGKLTGYGGGLSAKRWLLDFELSNR